METNEHITAEGLMTVAEVARQCSVSTRTVYRWIRNGLPIHRIPGTGARPILRISRRDLDECLSKTRQTSTDVARVDSPTIRLDGRKFIRITTAPVAPENRLDTRHDRASRVRPEGNRQR